MYIFKVSIFKTQNTIFASFKKMNNFATTLLLLLKKWFAMSRMRKSSGKVVAQLIKNLPAMQETWVQSPGEGNSYPLQYSGLENSMDYSMGSQRIRHDWVALNKTNAFKIGSVAIFQQPGAFKLYFDQGFSWFLCVSLDYCLVLLFPGWPHPDHLWKII